jgi:UDP-N-acetylmuramoyl-tripeptide--D-alanyl-D-alanine ligase
VSTSLTLQKMQTMVDGSHVVNASHAQFHDPILRFSTDSRKITPGDFFIAIVGEQFDGNDFIHDVMKKGAIGVLASKPESVPQGIPALIVEDTLKAMQQIAQAWRAELNTTIILVTGSNGKTTVKEMIASILREAFGASHVLATAGNLNNEIGLPLTLLGLQSAHRMAVIELGMNHPGETKILAKIAQPNIVLINNAQREHQEFMHTVQAVAQEHASAMGELSKDGVAIFPADSEFSDIWRDAASSKKIIDFALMTSSGDASGAVLGHWSKEGALEMQFQIDAIASEKIQVQLQTLGDHNAKNALAAAAVATAAKIPLRAIQKGLENFVPVAGRMRSHSLPGFNARSYLIDDTYNANPDSMIAAIDVLSKLPGKKWLILGDMGEVGNQGQQFHIEIGQYASKSGIDYLLATGVLAEHAITGFNTNAKQSGNKQGLHFADQKLLLKHFKSQLHEEEKNMQQKIAVLVKGSRFTKMERIVQALLKEESLCF